MVEHGQPFPWVIVCVVAVVFLLVGILVGYILRKSKAEKTIGSAETQAKNLILDAENRAEALRKELVAEAKSEAHQIKVEAEKDIKERRDDVKKSERRITQKEESVDRKLESIEKKEEDIQRRQQSLKDKEKNVDEIIKKQIAELERISGCTAEEAKQLLLRDLEKDIRHEASVMIKDIESKPKDEAPSSAARQTPSPRAPSRW